MLITNIPKRYTPFKTDTNILLLQRLKGLSHYICCFLFWKDLRTIAGFQFSLPEAIMCSEGEAFSSLTSWCFHHEKTKVDGEFTAWNTIPKHSSRLMQSGSKELKRTSSFNGIQLWDKIKGFRSWNIKIINESQSPSGATLKNRILGWMNHGKALPYPLRDS